MNEQNPQLVLPLAPTADAPLDDRTSEAGWSSFAQPPVYREELRVKAVVVQSEADYFYNHGHHSWDKD